MNMLPSATMMDVDTHTIPKHNGAQSPSSNCLSQLLEKSMNHGDSSPQPPPFEFPSPTRHSDEELVATDIPCVNSHYLVDYAHCCTQGLRDSLEDAYDIRDDDKYIFLGIYDGHDGRDVAQYLSQMFYQYFVESPFESIEEKFLNASERCDRGALLNQLQGGSTAAIVVLDKQTGDIHAYNVGDSEILLVLQSGVWRVLSTMHRPDEQAEIERIRKLKQEAQVTIEANRINSKRETRVCGYGVSRAFGDHTYAKMPNLPIDVLTSRGSYYRQVNPHEPYTIIIHCDGLTENQPHSRVIELLRNFDKNASALEISKHLVWDALVETRSTDNISVVVVKVFPASKNQKIPDSMPMLASLPQTKLSLTIDPSTFNIATVQRQRYQRPASPGRGKSTTPKTPRKSRVSVVSTVPNTKSESTPSCSPRRTSVRTKPATPKTPKR